MINKSYCTLICFLLGAASVLGQTDKVMLKNGSVLFGTVERLNVEGVRLTVENEVLTFPFESIRMVKIKDIESSDVDDSVYQQLSKYGRKGVDIGIQVGLLHGRLNSELTSNETFSVSAQGMYRFSQYLQTGISIGYDHHNEFGIFPLLLVYRADLSSKWSTPFFYGSAGYGFGWLLQSDDVNPGVDEVKGGANYQLGFGYRWRLEKIGLEFALGWKHQKVNFEYKNNDWFWIQNENNITLHRSINRAEFKFGIIF